MNAGLAALLDELHRRGTEHDAGEPDRLRRLRNLEPDTARLLAVLVRATRAREVLELGTSNGFSTLWLADAARAVGGRVVSVDLDAGRSAEAEENLRRAGLERFAELRVADAGAILRESADGAWDLIFLDAERADYPGYWPDLVRALRPHGLLVVDNAISHAEELRGLRDLIRADGRVQEALVPIGAGAMLVVREPVTSTQ